MSKFLDIAYAVFIGIFVAVFIGFGIAAFYPAPDMPEYPDALQEQFPREVDGELTSEAQAELDAIQTTYDEEWAAYEEAQAEYSRNVAIMALAASVLVLLLSLVTASSIGVIAEGLLLGGIFTLMYGVGRSFLTEDPKMIFVLVSVGLALTLAVGYWKFVRPRQSE